MPDPISKIAVQFDIARLNADHPLRQTQRTPSMPSSAIAPDLPPPRQHRQSRATTRPRVDLGIDRLRAEGPAASEAATTSGATPPFGTLPPNLPPVLRAMEQAQPDLRLVVPEIFGSRTESTDMLAETMSRLDVSDAHEVPGLPSAPVMLRILALAAGSKCNANDALQGLQVLRALDVTATIADAWRQRASNIDPDAAGPSETPAMDVGTATAWRALAALAATPDGLVWSRALLRRPIDASQALDVSLLLKAAAVAATEAGIGLDPIALLRLPATGRTLSGAAVMCAAARLAGDFAAATPLSWALVAVRNDLMHDGPGSDFAGINDRLMKMGRWVERATSNQESPPRHPMREKSPFRALRHGVQQVDRGPSIGRHKVARDQALRTAASALRDHLATMSTPACEASGQNGVPAALIRAAVLEHCLADTNAQGVERAGFDEDALEDIAALLGPRLTDLVLPDETLAATGSRLAALPEIRALADLRLDAATLSRWTEDARQAQDAKRPAPTVEDVPPTPLDIACTALQAARDEALGRDTRVVDIDRETVRAALQDIVRNIEGSSRLRLLAGGVSGVGLRQITATISALASALFLRGRVDARLQQGRQAVFEIAMPPYDVEIMLATQRQSKRTFGLGGFIGPDIGAGKIGINVDANVWTGEHSELAGITLRLPRVGVPVATMRREFSRLVDHLLDGSAGGSAMANPFSDATAVAAATTNVDAAGSGAHSLLRQLLQAFPDLTVNRIADGGDSRRRHGLNVDLAGSIGAGGFKASAGLGGYTEGQRDITRHYADATGRLRVVRSFRGDINTAGVAARAALGASHAVSSATGNVELGLLALPVAIGAERIVGGSFDRVEKVYEDGRLHPLSYVEREFQNVDEFLEHLKHELPDWLAAGAPPERLQKLLDEIRTHAQPTHTFSTRRIVTPEMKARDDAYRSTIDLLEQLPHSQDTVAALREAVEAQWQDRQCLQPYSIRAYDRQVSQQTLGIDLVAQLAAVDSAEASHIDNRLDVKPRTQIARPAPASPFQSMWSPPSRALLPVMASPDGISADAMAPLSNAMAAAHVFPADRLDLRRDIEDLQQRRAVQADEVARNAKASA
ncbi:hypothetical protein ACFX58_14615 [Sphingomonas sp. NCPPB 2930]